MVTRDLEVDVEVAEAAEEEVVEAEEVAVEAAEEEAVVVEEVVVGVERQRSSKMKSQNALFFKVGRANN